MIFKKHISNQKQVSNLIVKHQKHSHDGSAIITCQFKVGEEKKRQKLWRRQSHYYWKMVPPQAQEIQTQLKHYRRVKVAGDPAHAEGVSFLYVNKTSLTEGEKKEFSL